MIRKKSLEQFILQKLSPSIFKTYLERYLTRPDISTLPADADIDLKQIIDSWPIQVRNDLKRQCAAIISKYWGEGTLGSVARADASISSPKLFVSRSGDEIDSDTDHSSKSSNSDGGDFDGMIGFKQQGDNDDERWRHYVETMTQETARRYMDTFRFDPEFNIVYGVAANLAMTEVIDDMREDVHSNHMADNAHIDYKLALLIFPQALRTSAMTDRYLGLDDDQIIESCYMPEFHNRQFGL